MAQINGRGLLPPQIGNLGPSTIIIEFTPTSLKRLPSVGKTEPNIKKIKLLVLCTFWGTPRCGVRGELIYVMVVARGHFMNKCQGQEWIVCSCLELTILVKTCTYLQIPKIVTPYHCVRKRSNFLKNVSSDQMYS